MPLQVKAFEINKKCCGSGLTGAFRNIRQIWSMYWIAFSNPECSKNLLRTTTSQQQWWPQWPAENGNDSFAALVPYTVVTITLSPIQYDISNYKWFPHIISVGYTSRRPPVINLVIFGILLCWTASLTPRKSTGVYGSFILFLFSSLGYAPTYFNIWMVAEITIILIAATAIEPMLKVITAIPDRGDGHRANA